jgi:hypothetical protein
VNERGAVGDDDGEHVAEHGGVGLAVLGLRGARGPGDVEDVGDVGQRRQGLGDGGGVGEVDVHVGHGRKVTEGAMAYAVHEPSTQSRWPKDIYQTSCTSSASPRVLSNARRPLNN